jgi:hypothetical protein
VFKPVTVVVALLLGVGDAAAQDGEVTWDQAAARMPFPVYEPTVRLGMEEGTVRADYCELFERGYWFVSGGYRKPGSRQVFGFVQGRGLCGTPRVYQRVTKARINGRVWDVSVYCPEDRCRVRVKDGPRRGWSIIFRLPGGTRLHLTASGVSLKAFLRVARGFKRVDLTRPVINVGTFLSPDRRVWCTLGDEVFCVTQASPLNPYPHFSGRLTANGTFTACHGTGPGDVCAQNWDSSARALTLGQTVELGGYRCAAGAGGITCTVIATGRGFVINAAGVTELTS